MVNNHLKGPASIRNRLSFYYSFIKDHVLFAWPKNPLCLRCLYILYIFYITFNKRKKWESGPRCLQTLVLPRFRWPGFENKSGPRAKKSGPKYFSVRTNSSTAQIKVGQTHFQISISGPKRKARVGLGVYKKSQYPILLSVFANSFIAFSINPSSSCIRASFSGIL